MQTHGKRLTSAMLNVDRTHNLQQSTADQEVRDTLMYITPCVDVSYSLKESSAAGARTFSRH